MNELQGRVSGRIEGRIQVQWPDRTPDTSLTAVYGRPGLLSSLSNIEKSRSSTLFDSYSLQDSDPSKVHKRIITPPKIAPLGLTRTATEPSTGSPSTSPDTSPRTASSPRPVITPMGNPDSPRSRIGTRGIGLSPPTQGDIFLASPRELAQLGPPSNPETPNLSPKPSMVPRPSLTNLAENVLSSDNIDEIDALVEGESEMSHGFDEDLDYASIIDSIDELVMKSPTLADQQTQFEMTNSVDIPVNNNNVTTSEPMENSPSTEADDDDDDEVIEVIPASKRTYTISLSNSTGSGNNTPLSGTPSNALPIPGAEERRVSINRTSSMQFSSPPSTASPDSPDPQPKALTKSQSQKALPRSIIGHSPANSAPTNPLATSSEGLSNGSSATNSPSTPTGRLVLGRQRDKPAIAVHPPGPGQPQNGNTQ